jgi:hypothetical protein
MATSMRRLQVCLSLAAIALLGALAIPPVLAEEAGSAEHGDSQSATSGQSGGARSPAGDDKAGGTTQSDTTAKDASKDTSRDTNKDSSKGANTTAPAGNNASDIDTRISVQPRHPGARFGRDDIRNKVGSPAARNLLRRTFSPPRAPAAVMRNAVGVRVTPRDNAERGLAHPNAVGAARGPTSGPSLGAVRNSPAATTIIPGAVGSRITSFDHRAPTASPAVTAPAVNHGAINGTGVVRRNFGSAQIGGPKVSTAGINGTAIKPKRGF